MNQDLDDYISDAGVMVMSLGLLTSAILYLDLMTAFLYLMHSVTAVRIRPSGQFFLELAVAKCKLSHPRGGRAGAGHTCQLWSPLGASSRKVGWGVQA